MEKKYWMIASAVLIVVLFGFVSAKTIGSDATSSTITGGTTAEIMVAGVQEVYLGMDRSGYTVEPSTFKKDVAVRMEVDMSTVSGCMRSVNIPAFGVSKLVSEGDNIIEFTPDETGTFTITCSMNMGKGTFTVIE
jgi:uncharacterized protein